MDGVTNELSNISSMKDTKFGRDMHNVSIDFQTF